MTIEEQNPLVSRHHARIVELLKNSSIPIAKGNMELWKSLSSELIAIIGETGFQSLYQRCLHQVQRDHPFLNVADTMSPSPSSVSMQAQFLFMREQLQHYSEEECLQLSLILIDRFINLLSSLIGEELCDVVLLSAWPIHLNESDHQHGIPEPWHLLFNPNRTNEEN